jgi:heat shock protein HspQ
LAKTPQKRAVKKASRPSAQKTAKTAVRKPTRSTAGAPIKTPAKAKGRKAAKGAVRKARSVAPKRSIKKAVKSRSSRATRRAHPIERKRKPAGRAIRKAKFAVGQVVRHRFYSFRGVVFDIDPTFNNSEDWWLSIPAEIRPVKDQPYYHLLAENEETEYIAYVSEQNLLADDSGIPLRHPQLGDLFVEDEDGQYHAVYLQAH